MSNNGSLSSEGDVVDDENSDRESSSTEDKESNSLRKTRSGSLLSNGSGRRSIKMRRVGTSELEKKDRVFGNEYSPSTEPIPSKQVRKSRSGEMRKHSSSSRGSSNFRRVSSSNTGLSEKHGHSGMRKSRSGERTKGGMKRSISGDKMRRISTSNDGLNSMSFDINRRSSDDQSGMRRVSTLSEGLLDSGSYNASTSDFGGRSKISRSLSGSNRGRSVSGDLRNQQSMTGSVSGEMLGPDGNIRRSLSGELRRTGSGMKRSISGEVIHASTTSSRESLRLTIGSTNRRHSTAPRINSPTNNYSPHSPRSAGYSNRITSPSAGEYVASPRSHHSHSPNPEMTPRRLAAEQMTPRLNPNLIVEEEEDSSGEEDEDEYEAKDVEGPDAPPSPPSPSPSSGGSSVASEQIFETDETDSAIIRVKRKTMKMRMKLFRASLYKFWKNVLAPDRWVNQAWMTIILTVVIYCSFMISWRAFFFWGSYYWLFSDYLCSFVFFLDFLIQIYTYKKKSEEDAEDEEARHVTCCQRCCVNPCLYARSKWFWVDFLSILPLEIFGFIFLPDYWTFFMLNRLIKMFRLNHYVKEVQNSQMLNEVLHVNQAYFRLFSSFIITLASSHFMACGYFLVVYIEGDECDEEFILGGVDLLAMNPVQQYLRSYFWAFVSMTGYSNTQPVSNLETVCSLIVSAIGIFLYITIIGTVGSLVSNLDQLRREFQKRMDEINAFMNFRNLPSGLREQIVDYYDYLWKSRRSFEETKILEELPLNLKIAVARDINRGVIQSVDFLAESADDFLDYIALYLKPRIALPNVYIIREGDVGNDMYFIARGRVQVEMPDGSRKTLGKGDFFGEISLLYDIKRNASVRTLTYCDFYIILKKHFKRIMNRREFLEEKMRIMRYTKDRHDRPPVINVMDGTPTTPMDDEISLYE